MGPGSPDVPDASEEARLIYSTCIGDAPHRAPLPPAFHPRAHARRARPVGASSLPATRHGGGGGTAGACGSSLAKHSLCGARARQRGGPSPTGGRAVLCCAVLLCCAVGVGRAWPGEQGSRAARPGPRGRRRSGRQRAARVEFTRRVRALAGWVLLSVGAGCWAVAQAGRNGGRATRLGRRSTFDVFGGRLPQELSSRPPWSHTHVCAGSPPRACAVGGNVTDGRGGAGGSMAPLNASLWPQRTAVVRRAE